MQEAPGHCLALNGSTGAFVDVALRERIIVTALSIEHLHKGVAYDSRSAVRGWALHALPEEAQEEGEPASLRLLAQGAFDAAGGNPVQTFGVGGAAPAGRVRFAVLSNHGGEYTCLYRLRVHGRVAA